MDIVCILRNGFKLILHSAQKFEAWPHEDEAAPLGGPCLKKGVTKTHTKVKEKPLKRARTGKQL